MGVTIYTCRDISQLCPGSGGGGGLRWYIDSLVTFEVSHLTYHTLVLFDYTMFDFWCSQTSLFQVPLGQPKV